MRYISLVAFILLTACGEYDEKLAEHRHYCIMVSDYERTNGQHGWPAYKGKEGC
jgi:hypothetical protein